MLIELPIYCFMLIELYWNWLNYMLLLRNGELEMNIDNVFAMWIAIEKWWIESYCEWLVLAFDWFVYWCWEIVILVYVGLKNEMRIEMLSCWWWKNELSYWDYGIEICWIGLNWWTMWICLCLMVMSWLFKWLINMW